MMCESFSDLEFLQQRPSSPYRIMDPSVVGSPHTPHRSPPRRHNNDTNTNARNTTTTSTRYFGSRRINLHHGLLSPFCSASSPMLVYIMSVLVFSTCSLFASAQREQAFFNVTSSLRIPNSEWDLHQKKQFSFRTCKDSGILLSMRGSLLSSSSSSSSSSSQPSSSSPSSSPSSSDTQELALSLNDGSVVFLWSINGRSGTAAVGSGVNNNKWHTLTLRHYLGSLVLSLNTDSSPVTVANSTHNSFLLDTRLSGDLKVGDRLHGCVYEGQGVELDSGQAVSANVVWDECPLEQQIGCGDKDDCWNAPCVRGECEDIGDDFKCTCPRKYGGKQCEIDLVRLYACGAEPCLNGGTCINQTATGSDAKNYLCECPAGYTGVDCETVLDYCRTNPCQSGKCVNGINDYTCDCTNSGYSGDTCSEDVNECLVSQICGSNRCSNHPGGFSCNCLEGYEGTPCVEIDECASFPCQNGAGCNDGVNSFTCNCLSGYEGNQCETNIDDCAVFPCTDPHTKCVDGVNSYTCQCLDGFSGDPPNCQNIDECRENVCMNNASCDDTSGGYTCNCLPGFTGQNCEHDVDECGPSPCLNGANCTDLVNDYSCSCVAGYRGKNCDEDIDDCQGENCQNGGECRDKVNDFECVCQPGYEGRHCETDTDDCLNTPCKNGAQCTDQVNGFLCECAIGYNGTTCSTNIQDCLPNPCVNGGVCYDGVNDFSCICPDAWMGKTCDQKYNACSFKPCKNKGNCTTLAPLREYSCNCAIGFSGKDCEENIDDCLGNDCQSFEKCYDGINSFTCGCPIGYSGDDCTQEINECDTNPCLNGGVCHDGRGEYNCTCKQEVIDLTKYLGPKGLFLTGYNGTNCEIDINECDYTDPPICQNEGICQNNRPGSFMCYCKGQDEDGLLNVGKLCEVQKTYCDLAPEECANGGTCIELPSSSKCLCAPGFAGAFCKTDIDECESSPCQNGGTCSDRVNGFECTCIEGFTGHQCEHNIDDCRPDPCLNGGVCYDQINSFTCNCSDTGFEGDQCTINIDDCEVVPQPCKHGGSCVDGIKEYKCNCLPGYTGSECQVDIPECAANPCFNGSLCLEYSNETLYVNDSRFQNFTHEKAAGYLCECNPGLKGVNCTEDVNECEPDPCKNGAVCLNLFNKFKCRCAPGFYGDLCETEIDECVVLDPCKNGGTCQDLVADYNCTCPEAVIAQRNFAGKNCSTYLRGCDSNSQCGRNGDCLPALVDEKQGIHTFSCVCHTGYTGEYCDKSTVFTFGNGAFIRETLADLDFDLSLRFRTTLSEALLVHCKLGHQHWLAVRIHQGQIEFRHEDPNSNPSPSQWTTIVTAMPVNDALFHPLRLILTDNITVILSDDTCPTTSISGEGCRVEQDYVMGRPSLARPYLYIGSATDAGLTQRGTGTEINYVGCMEDVIFNGNLYYPGLNNGDYFHLKPGCSRSDQCGEDTCNGRGGCEDLWDRFLCHCQRPFYGDVCEKDVTPATFGRNPNEYVKFEFPPSQSNILSLSFLMTTRQSDGFIFFAGNNLDSPGQIAFVSFYTKDGFLVGDFVKCTYVKRFTTSTEISDGNSHQVELDIQPQKLAVTVDSAVVFEDNSVPDSATVCDRFYGFFVNTVYVGKIEDVNSRPRRKKRWIERLDEWGMEGWFIKEEEEEEEEEKVSLRKGQTGRKKRQAPSTGTEVLNENINMDPYVGVLQDMRVHVYKLSFSPNDTDGGILPKTFQASIGAQSTKDVCSEDTPCLNGGNCSNQFYNTFKCDCLRGYTGKNCSELDFCSYGTCPDQSTCVNIPDGYECVSTAQFSGSGSLTFALNGSPAPEPKVSIEFRTRSLFGVLFYAGHDGYFIKLRIAKGILEVNYKLSQDEFSKSVTTLTPKLVNDGEWYAARLDVTSVTTLELSVMHKDVSVAGTRTISLGSIDAGVDVTSMISSGSGLTLGSVFNPGAIDERKRETNFVGCMKEARIGGILLPFFTDDQFENNTAPVKYLVQDTATISRGCTGPDACASSKCVNGGKCVDLWYASMCQCVSGYEGDYCEENPDNCLGAPCQNQGKCVDGLNDFSCQCAKGFSGDRCEKDLNFCNSTITQCLNGGACKEEVNGFSCDCSEEFTGHLCGIRKKQSCSSGLCKNGGACRDVNVTIAGNQEPSFACDCVGGFEGPLCEVPLDGCASQPPPCDNGATCTTSLQHPYYTCDCSTTDYEGENCTQKIDNCQGVMCGGHGICSDLHRDYICACNQDYTGKDCETFVERCDYGITLCQRGTCRNNACVCTQSGYSGVYCEEEVDECNLANPVCVHDIGCDNLEGDYNCTCDLGYKGKNCDVPDCEDVCLNGAECIVEDNLWRCECPQFYEGRQCEVKGPCAFSPCNSFNTKVCSQNITQSSYTCDCKSGWEGKNCSDDIDECARGLHNCVNGTCKNTDGSFDCVCIPGFTDPRCSTDINECDPNPCYHNVACTNLINDYNCDCNGTGFRGKNCDNDIDECKESPSICNLGNCVNNNGGFDCDCGQLYLGFRCEYQDPCYNETCSTKGTCQKNQTLDGSFQGYCDCTDGYQGARCEKSRSTSDDDDVDIALIAGPIIGGLLFIIIIIVIIGFIMTTRSKRATRGAYSPSQQETSGSRVELGNVLKKPPEERLI